MVMGVAGRPLLLAAILTAAACACYAAAARRTRDIGQGRVS
ncbi:hypothetical protein [Nonomuraea cypriaca]|nr:hypothetical protein [Nonomuraea cypriaca]